MSRLPHDQYRAKLDSLAAQLDELRGNPPPTFPSPPSPSSCPVVQLQHGDHITQLADSSAPASTSSSTNTTAAFPPTATAMSLSHCTRHQALTPDHDSRVVQTPLSALTAAALRLSQASDEMNFLVLQCRASATLSNNAPALAKTQHGHEYEQNGPFRLPSVTWDSTRHGCQCCCQRAIPDVSRDGSDAMRTRAEHTAADAAATAGASTRNVKQEQHIDTHHIPEFSAGENPTTTVAQKADDANAVCRDSSTQDQDVVGHCPVSQVLSEGTSEGMVKRITPNDSLILSAPSTDKDDSKYHPHPTPQQPGSSSPSPASDPPRSPTRLPPSQPVPFTNMLDVNEPRYFPAAAAASPSLDGKERNLCRTVIVSNLPRSVSTISAVLRRVRGSTVIHAGIVDTSAWPTFQSSAALAHGGDSNADENEDDLPSARTA